MPAPNTPFLLPEIIKGIDTPSAVNELLELYAGPLTADNENNSIPVIVPVARTRMQNIADRYQDFETEFQTTFQLWEDLANRSLEITNLVTSIYNVAAATVDGSDIFMHARKEKEEMETFNKVLKSVFTGLIEHEFNVRHISWDGFLLIHKRLDELVQKKEYEPAFVIKDLKTISGDLQAYLESITWISLRTEIPTVLKNYIFLNIVNTHPTSLIDFINLVKKHKAANPLITGEMVDDVNRLEKMLNNLLSLFNAAINSIYRSEEKQEKMIEAINIYQMILNRLFTAENA